MRKIIIISLLAFSLLFGTSAAFAASGFGLEKTAVNAGYETTGASVTVASRVQTVVSVLLGFVATLFFGLTLYGGIMWMTARGKDERVAKAKEILEAAIIGLAVVGSSYAIATFILGRLGTSGGEIGCCYYTNTEGMQFEEIDKPSCDAKSGDWRVGTCSP